MQPGNEEEKMAVGKTAQLMDGGRTDGRAEERTHGRTTDRPTDGRTDGPTDRPTDWPTNRLTDFFSVNLTNFRQTRWSRSNKNASGVYWTPDSR